MTDQGQVLRPHGELSSGVLIVDKSQGETSFDVVRRVKRAAGTKTVGHTGTLDPMATGVLVVAFNQATKLVPYLMSDDKEYEATVAFGTATDSLDADGVPTDTAPLPRADVEQLHDALNEFQGEIEQQAPVFSALKQGGKALYKRARDGEKVDAPVRNVVCHGIELRGANVRNGEFVSVDIRVHCGKGFYIRSLARDIAVALGTVGHLTSLRRTRNGEFTVDDAVPSPLLARAAEQRTLAELAWLDLPAAWGARPLVSLDAVGAEHIRHGRPAYRDQTTGPPTGTKCMALGPDGQPLAIVDATDATFRAVRGFS